MSSLNIVCPHCFTRNRVPEPRLADRPKCGKCHEPLYAGAPLQVDAEHFERMIHDNDIPVIVDFWAEWCGPCKMFAPVYEQAARELEPHLRLVKVDTEANRTIAARHRIQSIPTLALFRGGREIARQSGAMTLGQFLAWTRNNAGLDGETTSTG